MKRTFNETVCSYDPSSKSKGVTSPAIAPVFKITQMTPNSSLLPGSAFGEFVDKRITASSKVNFSKLSPKEQKMRYINQKSEIKHLRRKLQKIERSSKSFQNELNQVQDPEQKELIESLCKALITGKLKPNTLGYNQVCTILRDVLQIPCNGTSCSISLPDKELSISYIEYENYARVSWSDSILMKMLGRKEVTREDPLTMLQIFSGPKILSKAKETEHEDSH